MRTWTVALTLRAAFDECALIGLYHDLTLTMSCDSTSTILDGLLFDCLSLCIDQCDSVTNVKCSSPFLYRGLSNQCCGQSRCEHIEFQISRILRTVAECCYFSLI